MADEPQRELGPVDTGAGSRRVAAVFSATARVSRMLEVEAALARAQAAAGLIPADAAEAIRMACHPHLMDADVITAEAIGAGSPVIPLVERLRALVPEEYSGYVHAGATTQDVVDTALVLQIRDALDILDDELVSVGTRASDLAAEHRETPMAGRTLLQQAAPVSFGAKVAQWLAVITRRLERLDALRPGLLVVQLGGATGTLAAMRGHGQDVVTRLAAELDLGQPDLPWHAARDRIADLASALAVIAGGVGKIATDVVLLAQSEVAEVRPSDGGRSSALPNKRNPIEAINARAAARLALGEATTLLASMWHEHERAAGDWQAEWVALPSLFVRCGGAVERLRTCLDNLVVDRGRMLEILEESNGLLMAEALAAALGEQIGPGEAHRLVGELCAETSASGRHLRDVATEDATVRENLGEQALTSAFDPRAALGDSGLFVDRAIVAFERAVAVRASRAR